MGRRRKLPKCSVLGCCKRVIVVIRIRGDGRAWYACDSDHARSLIWDMKDIWPDGRGITTEGVRNGQKAR